jgi:Class II Aldolase and Adducin N-terminal domain
VVRPLPVFTSSHLWLSCSGNTYNPADRRTSSPEHSKPADMSLLAPRALPKSARYFPRITSPSITRSFNTSTSSWATVQEQVTQTVDQPTLPFRYGSYTPSANVAQSKPVHHIRIPQFTSLQAERAFRKLHHAAALRWLGYQGYNNEGAGGHVTVRDPILPDHFWINPHGKSFSWMRPEDLVLVNEQGAVVDGEGGNMHSINPAGYVIHSAVHQARPDVVAAVHCHSVHGKAFSALGCELEPINQDACRYASCMY